MASFSPPGMWLREEGLLMPTQGIGSGREQCCE
jgi:hypothetical protein